MPVGKDIIKYEDDENEWEDHETHGLARPGTTKHKQYYYKRVAQSLVGHPRPQATCHLYLVNMTLTCPITEEQNTRGRKIYAPEETHRTFGLVSSRLIPKVSGRRSWEGFCFVLFFVTFSKKSIETLLPIPMSLMSSAWSVKAIVTSSRLLPSAPSTPSFFSPLTTFFLQPSHHLPPFSPFTTFFLQPPHHLLSSAPSLPSSFSPLTAFFLQPPYCILPSTPSPPSSFSPLTAFFLQPPHRLLLSSCFTAFSLKPPHCLLSDPLLHSSFSPLTAFFLQPPHRLLSDPYCILPSAPLLHSSFSPLTAFFFQPPSPPPSFSPPHCLLPSAPLIASFLGPPSSPSSFSPPPSSSPPHYLLRSAHHLLSAPLTAFFLQPHYHLLPSAPSLPSFFSPLTTFVLQPPHYLLPLAPSPPSSFSPLTPFSLQPPHSLLFSTTSPPSSFSPLNSIAFFTLSVHVFLDSLFSQGLVSLLLFPGSVLSLIPGRGQTSKAGHLSTSLMSDLLVCFLRPERDVHLNILKCIKFTKT